MGGVAKLSLVDRAINHQAELQLTQEQISQLIAIRQSFQAAALPLVSQAKRLRMEFETIVDEVPFEYQQALAKIEQIRDVGRQLDNLYLDKMVEVTMVLSPEQATQILAIYDSEADQYISGLVKASLSASEVSLIVQKAQEVAAILGQNPNPNPQQIQQVTKLLYDALSAVGILPIWKDN
jgi:hypothetical protein